MNRIAMLAVVSVALLKVCTPSRAGEVIAHPSVVLSAEEVRELFMGDKQLAGSLKLVPVDNGAQQADFLVKVLQMDPTRYTARWIKKAFREGLRAPMAKGNDAEVAAFVRATPGAVGYVRTASVGVQTLQKY